MAEKRRVLFLCTGNSARSQMAEGLVNHFLGDRWEAYSAGTLATGYVHPLAIRAMVELGIDISGHRSKSVDEFRDAEFDLVITVCDEAAENCPAWLEKGRVVHLGFRDPASLPGDEALQLEVFRAVRDAIREEVLGYLDWVTRIGMGKRKAAHGRRLAHTGRRAGDRHRFESRIC